jgi:PAS domain S-box-containing protein
LKLFWTKGINPRHGVLLLTVAVGIALIALLADELRREYVGGMDAAGLWRVSTLLVVLGLLSTAAFAALTRQHGKRERADAALRESEARLKLAVGAAKASLWERDLRNKKLYLSSEYQRQIGLGPEAFHGEYEYWENRLHPEDRERALDLVKDCSEGRTAGYDSEYRLRHTDGGYRWFLSRGALVRDEAGKPKRLIGVLIDITEVKRAEEAMRESEQRFRSLTNLSSDMYWEQDDQFRFTSMSGTGSRRVNVGTFPLIGKRRWEQNYINMTADRWAEHIALLEAHKPFRDMELCRLDESGGKVWISVSGEPMFDASGAFSGYRGVGKDITERKHDEEARQELEDRLRQAQKMEAIGTLAGGIAHDFNNIVATILGNAELASRDASPGHPVQESIAEIRKAGLRAKGVVQQILAFSREAKPESRLIRLQEVLAEDETLLRAALPSGVELHFSVAPDVPDVLADPTQVHQILLNLSTNSWQAMPRGIGRIEIALDSVTVDDDAAHLNHELLPGRYARLSVTDTGAGMDEPTLKRIFDPFFTTKEVGQGTGLGLAVVHGIMRVLGGAIEVASQPGRGTTFKLYFRAAMAGPAAQPAAPGVARRGNGQHILFLDDEEALAFLTRRALERDGYRVSAFTKTENALEELRAHPEAFDLVVTDLNMPGRSGLEVAKEIRALRPDLPVVLASGYVTKEVHAQARAAGVRDVIYKPNAVDELARTVGRVLTEIAAR